MKSQDPKKKKRTTSGTTHKSLRTKTRKQEKKKMVLGIKKKDAAYESQNQNPRNNTNQYLNKTKKRNKG